MISPDPLTLALEPLRIAYQQGRAGTELRLQGEEGMGTHTDYQPVRQQVEVAYRLGSLHRMWGKA